MKQFLILMLVVGVYHSVEAQFIKEKAIAAKVGLVSSVPLIENANVSSVGFAAEGAFVMKVARWFQLSPYAGCIIAQSGGKDLDGNHTEYKVETKAFYLGGKARIKAPIRWVAPFLEIGNGLSVGRFTTEVATYQSSSVNLSPHFLCSFGLALGRNGDVELAFSQYWHLSSRQATGGPFVGITFPIK